MEMIAIFIAMTRKEKVREILKRLYKVYPNPKKALTHKNALELLVTIRVFFLGLIAYSLS